MTPEELQKLCDDHWSYVEQVIRNEYNHPEEFLETYIESLKFHYTTAMAHGFKHGVAWIEKLMPILNGKDIPYEFTKTVDEKFWELI